MTHILVTPYSALGDAVRRHRPSRLLSLMEPHVETPEEIPPGCHLRICVHDIVEPVAGAIAPSSTHISDILAFAKTWDRSQPFLVHCWAGISRSTAAAFIVLCDMHGPGHEERIAKALRFHAPHAHPNRLMIRHADSLLGREGRMVLAVDAMGEPRIVAQGEVVSLPLSLDEL